MRLFAAVHPTRAAREHLVGALREVRELTGTALRDVTGEQARTDTLLAAQERAAFLAEAGRALLRAMIAAAQLE